MDAQSNGFVTRHFYYSQMERKKKFKQRSCQLFPCIPSESAYFLPVIPATTCDDIEHQYQKTINVNDGLNLGREGTRKCISNPFQEQIFLELMVGLHRLYL